MNKEKLIQIKRRLLALGLAGVVLGSTGCANDKTEKAEPSRSSISQGYSMLKTIINMLYKMEKQ